MIHDKLEKKISNLKNGDGNAFDYIYDHTHRAVYFTIFYIVKDKMYAEDILQDTFVRAISFINEYREGTNFIGWICSIGKSLALNHLKKYRREITGLHARARLCLERGIASFCISENLLFSQSAKAQRAFF